jgi:hypothetical protein
MRQALDSRNLGRAPKVTRASFADKTASALARSLRLSGSIDPASPLPAASGQPNMAFDPTCADERHAPKSLDAKQMTST